MTLILENRGLLTHWIYVTMYIIYRKKKVVEIKGIFGACQSLNYLTRNFKKNYIFVINKTNKIGKWNGIFWIK